MSFARALARDPALAAVALGRSLREAGLPVTPDRSETFARAASLLTPNAPKGARHLTGSGDEPSLGAPKGARHLAGSGGGPSLGAPKGARHLGRSGEGLYWAARLAFVTSREQVATFDAVYAAIVEGVADPASARRGDSAGGETVQAAARPPGEGPRRSVEGEGASGGGVPSPAAAGSGEAGGEAPVAVAASDVERLATARLDELTADELSALSSLIRRLAVATPPRRARRSRIATRGEHLDVRATLRRSRRTAGDPVVRLHRERRVKTRPLVALLDVSGSMAPYARAYLLLLEGAARGARAETFVFATRLTRVTRALRDGRPHEAMERASEAAPDWAGGTRIGEALRAFNDRWGRRGMARDAVVVIFSDGWERGDPALVGREMERLARLAYRIVWVNPRVAAPGFAPSTGGMAAALPFTDELVSGHSAASLDGVVEAIGRHR